ncbi:MAG TPA: hypothetical protein VGK74_20890 [Symbiobacteriaceae bacterium]|jgi:hypothetical protein
MGTQWNDVLKALEIMLVATPFMFGVLAIFALLTVGLSKIRKPPKSAH